MLTVFRISIFMNKNISSGRNSCLTGFFFTKYNNHKIFQYNKSALIAKRCLRNIWPSELLPLWISDNSPPQTWICTCFFLWTQRDGCCLCGKVWPNKNQPRANCSLLFTLQVPLTRTNRNPQSVQKSPSCSGEVKGTAVRFVSTPSASKSHWNLKRAKMFYSHSAVVFFN